MSATSNADDFNPELSTNPPYVHTSESLHYAVTHVFLPIDLPGDSDYTVEMDLSLLCAVCAAAHAYSTHVHGTSASQWHRITRMLDSLQMSVKSEHLDRDHVISQLREMQTGDILALPIRPHNSAIVLTKGDNCTGLESFEVSPHVDAVKKTSGSLICSYPECAIEIPNKIFDDGDSQFKLADSLCRPSTAHSNLPSPLPLHAEYITGLLSGILQVVDCTTDVPRIFKRVYDHHAGRSPHDSVPWRRSSLWFVIKVTIQMSLDRTPFGRGSYKRFLLFFMSTVARDVNLPILSTDLLHLMASKILRRMGKLASSIPDWLSQMVLETCADLRGILDARWTSRSTRSSPFRNPFQDELVRGTQLSLEHSREYICNALTNHGRKLVDTPFCPSHRRRGTIDDFLSSSGAFIDEGYDVDPVVTHYDVEQSVEHGIDDWLASVTNVDEACAQLEILMDKYMAKARESSTGPEAESIWLLTGIELFVAIDKLVVNEIPMLADYSPEIQIESLERLLLRKTTSLHRLSCAYQYLSVRHSQSHQGWSVLSDAFTEGSFAVRYYDQSPHLQQLKARIEEDAMGAGTEYREDPQQPCSEIEISKSPLPASPLHAKVVVFELRCPALIRIWRSAAARIRSDFYQDGRVEKGDLLSCASALQRYFVDRDGPPLNVSFLPFYPAGSQSRNGPILRYAIKSSIGLLTWQTWQSDSQYFPQMSPWMQFDPRFPLSRTSFARHASHTSNDVLTSQVDYPADFSHDEFITFGHLRSGGSLQWVNILQGLRNRTLNLRRRRSHFLLTIAVFQVGPLDLNTGEWIWHQDLQEPSFCNALLDELENVCSDVWAGSIDGTMMNTISLLLARVLTSSPCDAVPKRVIELLRRIRRKTFSWMQELSYNLAIAPTSKERSQLLWDMATTCRSTFDVDSATFLKLFQTAEDVDAALSCALFVPALRPQDDHVTLISNRDRSLSLALAGVLRDVILADPSDYGIDLAVRKIFPSHKPCANRWEQLQNPNDRWLICRAKEIVDHPSHVVHLNLFDSELRMDGQPSGGLPPAIRDDPEYKQIFRDQGFFLTRSSLPGMDFTTLTAPSDHKVHFSLRHDNPVIRMESDKSNDILELIPLSKLRGDLPPVLVDGHVHWLNLSTKIIEIRPLKHPWEHSPDNWRIDCASGQYRASKDRETLVDMRSPTGTMVSKCFECLNFPERKRSKSSYEYIYNSRSDNVLITTFLTNLQSISVQLCAVLPLHNLSFFVNKQGELESRDFKDMVYDENQCVGALYGLEHLLVLRPSAQGHPAELIPRRVLIPNCFLEVHDNHQVRVRTGEHRAIIPDEPLYHTYNVDTEMGCLVGSGSLISTRYLAELHSLTSCDRPDPLTGKTGDQAAYFLLQSAGCRSIMKLKALRRPYDELWISEPNLGCPQIDAWYTEIQKRYYWISNKDNSLVKPNEHRIHRAAYLFPWHTSGPTSPKDSDYDGGSDYLTACIPAESGAPSIPHLPQRDSTNEKITAPVKLDQLFSNRQVPKLPQRAPKLPPRDTLLDHCYKLKPSSEDIPKLDRLFACPAMNKYNSAFQQEYVGLLGQSMQRVHQGPPTIYCRLTGQDHIDTLRNHFLECRSSYSTTLNTLKERLGPTSDPYQQALSQFGQMHPITADILLQCLASTSQINLPVQWKKYLVSFALILLDLQRARRLLSFALDGLEEEFYRELETEVCEGWNPEEYSDWLLIQIQGNFLIRHTQAKTAMKMMSPTSGQNTLMQVNMGEGKSSVIIPIVAAALADGKQLARVIVPKALTVQMFELLVGRLGGLANRPIYYLPFSRSPSEHDQYGNVVGLQINDLHMHMLQCVAERGILLVQPEHVASLKLMCVEEQICKGKAVVNQLSKFQKLLQVHEYVTTSLLWKSVQEDSFIGNMFRSFSRRANHSSQKYIAQADHRDEDSAYKWLSLQKWMDAHVRDILDESDEILHPRFQLIYTIGSEQHMDGYPDRWTITQQLLRLVRQCVATLSRDHPDSIEYHCGSPGAFPYIRWVRTSKVGPRLVSMIVEEVMTGRLPGFSFEGISRELRDAIYNFISDKDALQLPGIVNTVKKFDRRSEQNRMWTGLVLLRGLLASNILLFALTEKRWRVDYGLVFQSQSQYSVDHTMLGVPYAKDKPTSTMLAVPYLAKDKPSPNTQFGHPDITIILTCLSYYYSGLSEEQLRTSFEILLDQDDPSTEYDLWIKDYDNESLPESLRKLVEINLRSSEQWDEDIFPLFSRNQGAIDFYLSRVVFPKEGKEFPWKISASSWDLVEKRNKDSKVITGFSGTNDVRWLLPMSIVQRELEHEQGTNARVLAYLLRSENDFYMKIHQNGKREITHEFLSAVANLEPKIHVLLDVGAQILDSSNIQVAKAWLHINCDAAGAVYFSRNDELMVLNRNGTSTPFASSPLSQQLDRCVVYLDHAHTRGTDIKLPIESRAAVMLGPKVTKDRLVQGCMRMRRLGRGHSVMFFAPPEVDLSIRALTKKKDPNTPVTTADVLCWAIHETWNDIQQRAPSWAQQAMDHKSRHDAWSRFCNDELTVEKLSDAWLQQERKSLEDLYVSCETEKSSATVLALDPGIWPHCKKLGVLSLPSMHMEEEQERDVNRQKEREREVELPPKAEPAEHSLHADVAAFVETGIIPSLHSGSAFRPVFTTLDKSSAATREANVWSPFLLATVDFCSTIKPDTTEGTIDQYLRPVQWVLSGKMNCGGPVLVLISPFEADRLMSAIRASENVHLHVYAPRTSQRMEPCDDLKLYSIPPLPSDWTPPWALIDQLNVFAGQLYLRDYKSYLRLCQFLGVSAEKLEDVGAVRWNLFNSPGSLKENKIMFSGSPLPSVMALVAIRNRGRPFAHTHMGKILQGKSLTEKDFEAPQSDASGDTNANKEIPSMFAPMGVNFVPQYGPGK